MKDKEKHGEILPLEGSPIKVHFSSILLLFSLLCLALSFYRIYSLFFVRKLFISFFAIIFRYLIVLQY